MSAAVALGFLASAGAVWQSSRVAFLGATDNTGDNWTAGTVSLNAGGTGGSRFTADRVKPGDTPTACVTVTYRGSLDAAVRLYVKQGEVGGDLGRYLNLTIEQGGPAASCAAITSPTTLYRGTLAEFAAASTNFATGVGAWAPSGDSQAATEYRFTWTVSDDNDAQGRTAAAKFTWEAQNA